MTARVLFLIVAAAAFWVVTGLPARHLGGGEDALLLSGVAVLLCLVPGVITLVWAGWNSKQSPQQQALAAMGATGVRMFVVLLATYALHQGVAFFRQPAFLLWVGGAYVFLLAVEVILLVQALKTQQPNNTGA